MANNAFINDAHDMTQRAIWNYSNYKTICSVGTVTAVNANPVSVNVQALVKYCDTLSEGVWQEYPELVDVPLAQMGSSAYSVYSPLNVGDTGIILWCDREIYTALSQSKPTVVQPNSGELSELNACIFIPFLQLFNKASVIQASGYDVVSSDVSLVNSIISDLNNLTSLLSTLQTFNNAIVTAGAPYASSPSTPVTGSYAIALTSAANAANTSIASVLNSCSTLATNLAKFLGMQP